MCKIQANIAKLNQTDECDNNSHRERENPRVHTRIGTPNNTPRHKKKRKSTQERTLINAHANTETHDHSPPKASKDGIQPKLT